MMKKLSALLLALAMLLSLSVTTMAVEGEVDGEDSGKEVVFHLSGEGHSGNYVVTASVDAESGMDYGYIDIHYDPAQLMYIRTEVGGLLAGARFNLNNSVSGCVRLAFVSGETVVEAGDVISVQFVCLAEEGTELAVSVDSEGGLYGDEQLVVSYDGVLLAPAGAPDSTGTPVRPTTPDEPDEPEEPDEPVTPDEPDEPVTPDEPDEPVTPVTPDEPDEPVKPVENPYSDVTENDWYYKAALYCYEQGLIRGTGAGEFAADTLTSRATVVTILHRMSGEPAATVEHGFADVESGMWYSEAIAWAAELGIAQGGDGKFDPDGNITREQLATFLYRYVKATGVKLPHVDSLNTPDLPDLHQVSQFAEDAVTWALQYGLIRGTGDGKLDPQGLCTRAEAATVIARLAELIGK